MLASALELSASSPPLAEALQRSFGRTGLGTLCFNLKLAKQPEPVLQGSRNSGSHLASPTFAVSTLGQMRHDRSPCGALIPGGGKGRQTARTATLQTFPPGPSTLQENTWPLGLVLAGGGQVGPRTLARAVWRGGLSEFRCCTAPLPGHEVRAGPPDAPVPGGPSAAQLCGDSRPGLGSGQPVRQETWSGRALRAPSQPQSGLKSIFHSTAPKSLPAPTPLFQPPWASWKGVASGRDDLRSTPYSPSRSGQSQAGHHRGAACNAFERNFYPFCGE